jgi:hypothetical protein
MANKFTIADMEAHFGIGIHFQYYLVWGVATTYTIRQAGDHPKMRLKSAHVINVNEALNATEPVINIQHGANEVVTTVDMATAMGATAAIGVMSNLTVLEAYKVLEAEEPLKVQVETADAGSATTAGLLDFEYELVE